MTVYKEREGVCAVCSVLLEPGSCWVLITVAHIVLVTCDQVRTWSVAEALLRRPRGLLM